MRYQIDPAGRITVLQTGLSGLGVTFLKRSAFPAATSLRPLSPEARRSSAPKDPEPAPPTVVCETGWWEYNAQQGWHPVYKRYRYAGTECPGGWRTVKRQPDPWRPRLV